MKELDFYQLFLDELEDMASSESQIIASLPKLIKLASSKELKESLTHHLEETKNQLARIKKMFSFLDEPFKQKTCDAMKGLLKEAEELVKDKTPSSTLDAAIISAAQKVEHYEIASYGTLRSFAKHLELDKEIAKLIQETLDEEGNANKKLTHLADGSFFTAGINQEAATYNG